MVNAVSRSARLSFTLVTLVGLGACSELPSMPRLGSVPVPGLDVFDSPRTLRGHMVDNEDLGQVVPGVSSRADVEAVLGTPSATGTFDDSEWYYIGGVTRQRPGRTLAVVDQQVVKIRFDQAGRVQDVTRLGPEDGRDVRVVARTTPSPGNERTLLQQLFGNLGRLGPGIGNQPTTGPGAPSPGAR